MEKLSGEMEETSCCKSERWGIGVSSNARRGGEGGGRRRGKEGNEKTHSNETFPLIWEIELSDSSYGFSDLSERVRKTESALWNEEE